MSRLHMEIAEQTRVSQTGSSLLRSLQNNDVPIVELLVRESIQNSLDATNNENDFVEVKYNIEEFNSEKFASEISEIKEKLIQKFPGNQKYICIRDYNTYGLTGPIHYDYIKNNNYGNLIKLVYEISKPQEKEGSGGSWGLGKTVYYRIGIGIVIYYSRIKKNNGYESRLVVSLFEDEKKNDGLIPYENVKGIKRGLAWWGEHHSDGKTTIPVTNEEYINRFLEIFNIEPYKNHETGTTIIIPYINEEEIVKNNVSEEYKEKKLYKYIENFIEMSVQKWYAPRLNNRHYKYKPYLKAYIDDEEIEKKEMYSFFDLLQEMYNYSIKKNNKEYFKQYGVEVNEEIITVNNYMSETLAGKLVFIDANDEILGKLPPKNNPEINSFLRKKNENIVLTFMRKPGMIVSYETSGEWIGNLSSKLENRNIIGLFILNSDNKLRESGIYLDEYMRRGEKADHFSWCDSNINNERINLLERIQTNIRAKIEKTYKKKADDNKEVEYNSGLSKIYGENLLPKRGYGKGASKSISKGSSNNRISRKKRFSVKYNDDIVYNNDGFEMDIDIESNGKIKFAYLNTYISVENGKLGTLEWNEQMQHIFKKEVFFIKKISAYADGVDISSKVKVLKGNCDAKIDIENRSNIKIKPEFYVGDKNLEIFVELKGKI